MAEGLQGISRPWWQGLEEIFIFLKNSNKKLGYFLAFLADMADLIKIGRNTDKEEEATEDSVERPVL